jgi:hypothetical protein
MYLQEFRKIGYVTQYGEDSAAVGTFTYRLKGFDQQPTDHYSRTLYHVSDHLFMNYSHLLLLLLLFRLPKKKNTRIIRRRVLAVNHSTQCSGGMRMTLWNAIRVMFPSLVVCIIRTCVTMI